MNFADISIVIYETIAREKVPLLSGMICNTAGQTLAQAPAQVMGKPFAVLLEIEGVHPFSKETMALYTVFSVWIFWGFFDSLNILTCK